MMMEMRLSLRLFLKFDTDEHRLKARTNADKELKLKEGFFQTI